MSYGRKKDAWLFGRMATDRKSYMSIILSVKLSFQSKKVSQIEWQPTESLHAVQMILSLKWLSARCDLNWSKIWMFNRPLWIQRNDFFGQMSSAKMTSVKISTEKVSWKEFCLDILTENHMSEGRKVSLTVWPNDNWPKIERLKKFYRKKSAEMHVW